MSYILQSTYQHVTLQVLACASPNDRGSLLQTREACHTLAQFCLNRLGGCATHSSTGNVGLKVWLAPLVSFCTGEAALTKSERRSLIEGLKGSVFPKGFQMSSIADCKQPSFKLFESAETPDSSEVGRPQTDLTNLLLEQLQTPIEEYERSDQYEAHDQGR